MNDTQAKKSAIQAPRLRLVAGSDERSSARPPGWSPSLVLGADAIAAGGRQFALSEAARVRHVYVSGMPGTGKSTLLLNLIRRDLRSGNGCCVLDPHGGLVDAVLASREALDDRIVVVSPAEREFPVGLDLLDAADEEEQDLVVQFFLDLLGRLFLAEHQGPVLQQAVRNGLLLLMGGRRTLAEFPLLFTDPAYLKRLLGECRDPFVRRYFERVWGKTTDFHKSEHLAYFTSKFSPFFEDRLMRSVLAQRGGVDLARAMREGQVILVDLSWGRIGQGNARLLGQVVLHLVRRVAMRRDLHGRAPLFSVVVDEAHEFAGAELRELITAMRKFQVGVVLANQSLADFASPVRSTILGSVGTFVALRQGPWADRAIEAVFQPRFDDADLAHLPDYTAIAYTSTATRYTPPRKIRLAAPPHHLDPDRAPVRRRLSAERHGRPRAEVEAELLAAAAPPPPPGSDAACAKPLPPAAEQGQESAAVVTTPAPSITSQPQQLSLPLAAR